MTFACATVAELRVARRSGARSALVGLGASNGVPDEPVVSFGLTGALRDGLAPGTVVDATRVVDVEGTVLWDDGPLGVEGAESVTILVASTTVPGARPSRRAPVKPNETTGPSGTPLRAPSPTSADRTPARRAARCSAAVAQAKVTPSASMPRCGRSP